MEKFSSRKMIGYEYVYYSIWGGTWSRGGKGKQGDLLESMVHTRAVAGQGMNRSE